MGLKKIIFLISQIPFFQICIFREFLKENNYFWNVIQYNTAKGKELCSPFYSDNNCYYSVILEIIRFLDIFFGFFESYVWRSTSPTASYSIIIGITGSAESSLLSLPIEPESNFSDSTVNCVQ